MNPSPRSQFLRSCLTPSGTVVRRSPKANSTMADQQFLQMSDEEAIYQESVALMEKRGRRLRRAALTAGVFQAVGIVSLIYSTIAIRWVLIEWQEPDRTMYAIAESMGLFKLGLLTDGLTAVSNTLVGVLVGLILIGAGVNPATSACIIVFKILEQAIMSFNIVFMMIAGIMVDDNLSIYKTIQNTFYSNNMPPIGNQIAYMMLLLNKYGSVFAQVFSGIYLLLLGMTIVFWGVFPRWMGYLITIAGPLLIFNSLLYVIWPGYDGDMGLLFSFPMLLSQFWMCGWMLVNVPHPAKNREFFGSSPTEEKTEEK